MSIHRAIGGYGMPVSLNKVSDYFWDAEYETLDYAFAEEYFLCHGDIPVGACTTFVSGNEFCRNLDWLYSEMSEFFIHTPARPGKYSVHGFAGGLSKLTEKFVSSGKRDSLYKVLPFMLQDGINGFGLTMCMNVVPTDYGEYEDSEAYGKTLLSGMALVRMVLENCKTVSEAEEYLSSKAIYFASSIHAMNYELHFPIFDGHAFKVIEFVDGQTHILDANVVTNFYLYGVTPNENGTIYTPETMDEAHDAILTNGITENGSGLERFNLVLEMLRSSASSESILENLFYTSAYSGSDHEANPKWFTEYVSKNGLSVNDTPISFDSLYAEYGTKFANRSRLSPETWVTTHSVIYSYENGTCHVKLCVQESSDWMEFTYSRGKIKMGYAYIYNNKKKKPFVILDSAEDIADVPTDKFFIGTVAMTADESVKYRLSASRSWVEAANKETPVTPSYMCVNFSSEDGINYTCSHSYEEILEAYGLGLPIIGGLLETPSSVAGIMLKEIIVNENNAVSFYNIDVSNSGIKKIEIVLNETDEVSIVETVYPAEVSGS